MPGNANSIFFFLLQGGFVNMSNTATLLLTCPDQKGLVADISKFIFENNGNIVHADQYTDSDARTFFMRMEWEKKGFQIPFKEFPLAFDSLIKKYQLQWSLHESERLPRIAIFVSRQGHCLYDLLSRYQDQEFPAEILLIISNHNDMEKAAKSFQIPFFCFHVTKENKIEQEQKELELLKQHNIDLVVLARYMQVISGNFIQYYPHRIINIHHSFLPAFIGGKPYHQAYQRGVKIIGATSHYVTEELDEGPIIEQDVIRVSHRDTVPDLIRKGRDLEKVVLARAIRIHLQHRVMVHGNKTIVFD